MNEKKEDKEYLFFFSGGRTKIWWERWRERESVREGEEGQSGLFSFLRKKMENGDDTAEKKNDEAESRGFGWRGNSSKQISSNEYLLLSKMRIKRTSFESTSRKLNFKRNSNNTKGRERGREREREMVREEKRLEVRKRPKKANEVLTWEKWERERETDQWEALFPDDDEARVI